MGFVKRSLRFSLEDGFHTIENGIHDVSVAPKGFASNLGYFTKRVFPSRRSAVWPLLGADREVVIFYRKGPETTQMPQNDFAQRMTLFILINFLDSNITIYYSGIIK